MWGERDGDAGYTHGLLIDRRYKGDGLGQQLLAFAERTIEESGRSLSRLDTVTSNSALRQYYRAAGYTEVGERVFETGKPFDTGAHRVGDPVREEVDLKPQQAAYRERIRWSGPLSSN